MTVLTGTVSRRYTPGLFLGMWLPTELGVWGRTAQGVWVEARVICSKGGSPSMPRQQIQCRTSRRFLDPGARASPVAFVSRRPSPASVSSLPPSHSSALFTVIMFCYLSNSFLVWYTITLRRPTP